MAEVESSHAERKFGAEDRASLSGGRWRACLRGFTAFEFVE
jgi:hypothetical protein